MACNDTLAQASESLRLVENPSSGQIADFDSLPKVVRPQRGELARCCMTQSLGAIVFVDDHGEIEETLMRDIL